MPSNTCKGSRKLQIDFRFQYKLTYFSGCARVRRRRANKRTDALINFVTYYRVSLFLRNKLSTHVWVLSVCNHWSKSGCNKVETFLKTFLSIHPIWPTYVPILLESQRMWIHYFRVHYWYVGERKTRRKVLEAIHTKWKTYVTKTLQWLSWTTTTTTIRPTHIFDGCRLLKHCTGFWQEKSYGQRDSILLTHKCLSCPKNSRFYSQLVHFGRTNTCCSIEQSFRKTDILFKFIISYQL